VTSEITSLLILFTTRNVQLVKLTMSWNIVVG